MYNQISGFSSKSLDKYQKISFSSKADFLKVYILCLHHLSSFVARACEKKNSCALTMATPMDIDSGDKRISVFYRLSFSQNDTKEVASMEGHLPRGNGKPTPHLEPSIPTCRYWLRGVCTRGVDCRFLHGGDTMEE